MEIPAYATYRAGLRDPGMAGDALRASGLVPSVPVVPLQGNLHYAPLPAFSGDTSSDPSTLQVHDAAPFGFGDLHRPFLGPAANTGPNLTAREGSTVTLNGSGIDPQGLQLTCQRSLATRTADGAITLGAQTGAGGQLTDRFGNNPGVADVPPAATVPRLSTGVNATLTFGGGSGIAAITATSPIFTAVLAVSLEDHQ